MKKLTITMLSLILVMLAYIQAQSMGMGEKMDQAKQGTMQHENTQMQGDDMMKDNAVNMQKDEMKMDQTTIPTDQELRRLLTPLQYKVTKENGTEPPFNNSYWDNHEAGIYVDIISGKPLFSSTDKYVSGTGWPSFTKPLDPDQIVEKVDRGFFSERTEIRSKAADAHLGHVFDDGPPPTGLRYCMNSAALRFIPAADLEKEGYGEYAALFK